MQFRKVPFVDPVARARNPNFLGNDFGPKYPNPSFLGDASTPVKTTIIMRPQQDAPPGFPGFFGWLKATHPDFYNYAVAALPSYSTFTEGHRTGGATMAGLGDDSDLSTVDVGTIDPGSVPSVNIPDAGGGATGSPAPSTSTAAQIISTLTQAAPSILSDVNQQQIFQTQLQRAAAGLPPLNTSAYGLTGSGVTGLSSTALLALLGVGALVLVMAGKKG